MRAPYYSVRSLGCTPAGACGCNSRGLGRLGSATGTAGQVSTYADYVNAIRQAFGGDAAGGAYTAAIAYAGVIAAIGNAVANFLNKSGDVKSAATSDLLATLSSMGILKMVSARPPVYLIPDQCRVLRPDQYARNVSEAIRLNKSPTEVASAFKAWIDSAQPWGGAGCNPTLTPAPTPSPTPAPASVYVAPTPAPSVTPSALAPVSLSSSVSPPVQKGNGMTPAEQQQRAASVSGSGASLLTAYSAVAGTVPGRLFGVPKMEQVIAAIGQAGKWPNVKKWGDAVVDQVVMTGCKGCTPPTMIDFVRQKLSQGQNNPVTMVNDWTAWVQSNWGSKWLVASAGDLQRQALIDTLDALIAQVNPQAPIFYAQPTAEAAPAPTPTPTGVPTVVSPAPTPIPLPGTSVVPTPAGPVTTIPQPTNTTDPALKAMIDQLLAQGATSQQAYMAAIQALQNSGQTITPQVQQQVADQVQTAAAPQQANVMYLALGAGAIILAGILMSRRGKR